MNHLRNFVEAFGFRFRGGKGSHRIFCERRDKVMSMYRYAIEIFYSKEDEGYIAVVPELPGCSAFGKTEEEALEEVKVAMKLWLETARKEGREMPKNFFCTFQ